MRSLTLSAAAGVMALLASPPSLAGFGYCTTSVPNSQSVSNGWGMVTPKYVSAVLDFGEDYQVAKSAAEQFGAAHGTGANTGECYRSYERADLAAEARLAVLSDTHVRNIDTGWTGGLAAGRPGPSQPDAPGGFYMTIEDNGQAARIKAWNDSVLQAQREQAQRKAVMASQTAETKARQMAIMEKALSDLRSKRKL